MMTRKKLLLLSAFSMLLIVLTGCSDDKITPAEAISKVYRGGELSLTLNDMEKKHVHVNFQTTDMQVANLMIHNVIPGEDSLVFSGLELMRLHDRPGYRFKSESQTADRLITLSGTIDEKLTVDLSYTSLSPVVGFWSLSRQPIQLTIQPGKGYEYIDMFGFYNLREIPVNSTVDPHAEETLEALLNESLGPLLAMFVTLNIDLQETGGLIASWGGMAPEGQSKPNMVQFNTSEKELYISVALESILFPQEETVESKTKASKAKDAGFDLGEDLLPLYDLLSMVYKGLPLKYDLSEDQSALSVYVDKEMMTPYASSVMHTAVSLLKNIDLDANPMLGGILKELGVTPAFFEGFLPAMAELIENSESVDIRFNVNRVSEEKSLKLNQKEVLDYLQNERKKLDNKKQ